MNLTLSLSKKAATNFHQALHYGKLSSTTLAGKYDTMETEGICLQFFD